jgi:hypothetical protein
MHLRQKPLLPIEAARIDDDHAGQRDQIGFACNQDCLCLFEGSDQSDRDYGRLKVR